MYARPMAKRRRSKAPLGSHLERARCGRCGGVLGPDDEPHERCEAEGPRERMARVLLSLDAETLATLDAIGPSRSEAVRKLAAAHRKRK